MYIALYFCVLPSTDQWSEEYVLFLLDCIESPPEEDDEEQVPDAFLNMILSFNQHFRGVCVCVCEWAFLPTVGIARGWLRFFC